jgi:catechol 2,3-dioxygenase-like lactoylglutathione lyase family enzyme
MLIDRIDHVVLPVLDLAAASEPFERLGLKLTPPSKHRGQGTENRAFFVGAGRSQFYVELLAVHDENQAATAGRIEYLEAARKGAALNRVVFGTGDLAAIEAALRQAGMESAPYVVVNDSGEKVCDVLPFGTDLLGVRAAAIQYEGDLDARFERRRANGLLGHDFPLKRLDHLAALALDLAGTERGWTQILGVPVHGEIRGRGIVIRQMKVGDAILELLAPEAADSPMRQRPPGLSSMCAFEVPDVDAAVALARERGFTPSDPATGVLPGTRVATIPGAQLSGMGMQLLEYV